MIDESADAAADNRPAGPSAPARDDVRRWGVADLPGTAWRHKLLIGAVTVLTLGAVLTGAHFLKPRYLATAQVYIDSRNVQVVKTDIAANSADAAAFTNFVESQALLVTSDKVMELAVTAKRPGGPPLIQIPEFAGADAVGEAADAAAIETATRTAVETLQKQTTVRRPERTSFLEVTVSSSDAIRAADAANAVAQGYLTLVAINERQLATRATLQLTESNKTLAAKVREAEDEVERFKSSHNLVGSKGSAVSESQFNDLNGQLAAIRGRIAQAQARYDQILAAKRSPAAFGALPEALGSTTLGSLRVQDVEAKRQLASLTAVLGPQHPSIRAAQAQVQNTELAIAGELGRIVASAKDDLDRAKQNETTLVRTLEDLKNQVAVAGSDLVALRDYEQKAEAARNVYQQFLNRSRETDELANVDTTNNTIVSPAQAPRSRAFPPRLSILALLGAGLGLALGLTLAVLVDMRRAAVFAAKPEKQPAAPLAIEIPPRAETPSMEAPSMPPPVAAKAAAGPAPAFGVLAPSVQAPAPEGSEIPDLRRIGVPILQGEAPEQNRFLADVLDEAARRGLRCLLVAGRNNAFDHTALAVSLALAAKARGDRVALMDTDAKKRQLTRAIGATQSGAAAIASARKLYRETANDIGLILLPLPRVMQLDPAKVHETVYGAEAADTLLICDGSDDAAAALTPFAGAGGIGVVLIVEESAYRAGLPQLADATFLHDVLGVATAGAMRQAA